MYQDPNLQRDPSLGYGGVPQSSNPYGIPASQPPQQNPYPYELPAQNSYNPGYGQPAQAPQPGFNVPIPGYGSQPDYGMSPNNGTLSNNGAQPINQQKNLSRPRRWYGNVRRVLYGSLWSFYTVLLVFSFFHFLSIGEIGTGLFSGVLALLIGNYAYRIWTWRARHLWFLIFF